MRMAYSYSYRVATGIFTIGIGTPKGTLDFLHASLRADGQLMAEEHMRLSAEQEK
jgi:hypothetical protein